MAFVNCHPRRLWFGCSDNYLKFSGIRIALAKVCTRVTSKFPQRACLHVWHLFLPLWKTWNYTLCVQDTWTVFPTRSGKVLHAYPVGLGLRWNQQFSLASRLIWVLIMMVCLAEIPKLERLLLNGVFAHRSHCKGWEMHSYHRNGDASCQVLTTAVLFLMANTLWLFLSDFV